MVCFWRFLGGPLIKLHVVPACIHGGVAWSGIYSGSVRGRQRFYRPNLWGWSCVPLSKASGRRIRGTPCRCRFSCRPKGWASMCGWLFLKFTERNGPKFILSHFWHKGRLGVPLFRSLPASWMLDSTSASSPKWKELLFRRIVFRLKVWCMCLFWWGLAWVLRLLSS
jgi:hypothetical protein